ncbi:MAG: YceI family protein [Phycisphaerales bacterium]|nr:MAG: YceI family protein [Phycisphaerales bacterium]
MLMLRHLTRTLALPILLLPLSASPAARVQPRPETFKVDPAHSTVIFKVDHLGVGHFYGRFNNVRGGFTWDEEDPANGSMRILVDAESVDTSDHSRDERFRGEEFLKAGDFPTLSFTSKSIERLHGSVFRIGGDLTLRGVRRPVTAQLQWLGSADTSRHGYRGGFEAGLTISRGDFGSTGGRDGGEFGDEVTLIIAIEGLRK